MFCKGASVSGPFWDHVLDYWKQSLEKPGKVLFLKYEGMKEKSGFHLKLLTEFVGCPISPEEGRSGLVEEILGLCSFDNLRNIDVNKYGRGRIVGYKAFFSER
ncbi:hypothetical protein ACH5RR_030393 [Cinchona calisaya]|uniref:Sulfotransferase n=1 Tax=Cinchona calisaya TaxID=153742 RepID=A0ABD2YYR9_9GENT